MFSTSRNEKMAEVLTGAERRRRRTPQEKITMVQQTFEPGMTVSHVARLHDVNANQLFKWRKQFQEGSLTAITAGEDVVPASELAAAIKQIRELQRLLGKTWEGKDPQSCGGWSAKNGLRMRPLLPGTTIGSGEASPWCIACAAIPFMFIETWIWRDGPATSPPR